MNVLLVTAYPPVLHRHGGGVRMFHNIRILAEKHNVHVLSFMNIDENEEILDPIRPFCQSVRGIRRIPDFRPHWLSVKPFMVREFSTPEMHRAVDALIREKKIDVLQCEYLQMAQFRRRSVFSILTAHEAQSKNAWEFFESESDPLLKLKFFYRWMQMLRYETEQIQKFDLVVTMTSEDADYFRSYVPDAVLRSIPIGVDSDEFKPLESAAKDPIRVVFVGNFLHPPNVEAARFLVNHVAASLPALRFEIVGVPIPDGLQPVANVELMGHIPSTHGLYQTPNTIVATPLFSGTGQRVKLLEAFCMACPVVTTRTGAMGFPVQDGVHVLLAESVEDFQKALRRLAEEPALRKRLGHNARAMILDRFTWRTIGKDLLDVVAEAAVSR